ncbi:MAG: NAD(P)-binding domain-containing protein, partial [Chloroflexota bacterium]
MKHTTLNMRLLELIETRRAKIGVVGLGYVGLPLVVAYLNAGFEVVGVDVDPEKVSLLNEGVSYIEDIPSEQLAPHIQSNKFVAAEDYTVLSECDAISICVPTPLRKTKDPDISYIVYAAEQIAQLDYTGKLIVLESTTYPGTTDEVILPMLTTDILQAGRDFFLAFSPERIDPGRIDYTLQTTPKVIGGTTKRCT